ncbi:MAG: hypothetical protein KTR31_18660 [Myxococcales bacterium]|nr:hypothetical protein [Myxococcales bacterium]
MSVLRMSFLAGAIAAVAVGCQVFQASCTQIGCTSGLILTLDAPNGAAAGDYEIRLSDSDDNSFLCTFTKLDVCDAEGCLQDVECIGDVDLVHTELGGDIFDLTLNAGTTGDEVELTIEIDGAPVQEEVRGVTYVEFQPNGPACPPTCSTATTDFILVNPAL